MNICILKLSAIGDCICVVPAVRALQRQYPKASITWIISEPAYSLLKGLSGVEFIVIKKPKSLKDYLSFRRVSGVGSREFDVLLAMQTSMRSNFLLPFIKAKRKVGFDKKRSKELQGWFVNEQIAAGEQHYVEQYLNFVLRVGGRESGVGGRESGDFLLSVDDHDKKLVAALLDAQKKYLVVNPVASTADKTWLPERYAELIQRAHDELGYEIILTGGPGDKEKMFVDDILSAIDFPVLNLTGEHALTLKQLAALFQQVALVVSPDTGPMHLADAMGVKVIGLFAVTDPRLSGPFHNLDKVVSVYPEELPFGKRLHDKNAMANISVIDTVEKIHSLT